MPDSPVISGVADLPKFYFAEGSAFRLVANIDADLPLSGKFVSFGTRARSGTVRRVFSTDSDEANLSIASQAITLNIATDDETVPAFSGGWTLADIQAKGETEYWIDISATEGGDVILRLQGQADWVAAGSEIADSTATVTTPEIDVTITSGAVTVTASVVGGEVGVPAGGSTGQVLRKASGSDYATEWATVSGTGDVVGPASSTDNAIVRFNGTGGTSIQNSGITIADGASGTLAGSNSGDVTLAGTPDYLTISGQTITRGAIDLTTDVTGTLPAANGGTGQTSLGAVDAADFGSGAATDGYVLTADGAGGAAWEVSSGGGGGGGDAVTSGTLDQFADVTQTGGATLAITASTTLNGGTHSGTNTGDNAVNSLYSGLVSNATHTGDATGATALTLATVNSNVGSFGSATAAPSFTVNAKGLITAASSSTITPAIGSVTGLGTGVATALAINTGTSGAVLTLGGALGTPSSGTLSGCSGLPISGLTASTSTALGVGSVNLGHASDTTIARVSAGVISVEGATVYTQGGALGTPASGTLTNCTGLPNAGVVGLGGAALLAVGTTAGTVCAGDDSRLSDARTPTSHVHGNITNAGAIGSTSGLPVKTGTSGVLEAGAFGTSAGQFAEGNHAHEGTAILSTGEAGGTKFLREDGDGTCSWQTIAGGGDALTANPLSQFAATTSSQLAGVISDETGSGALVFATSPTLVTPALGTPSALVLTNATGLPTAGIVDDAVTLGKMASGTAGNLITYDASGNPAAVATGTAGQVLTSNGTGAAPTFQTASGGGGSGWTLIGEGTATSVSTLVEDSIFTDDYDEYQIVLIGAKIDTDTAALRIKLRASGSDLTDYYSLAGVSVNTGGGAPSALYAITGYGQAFWTLYGGDGTGTGEYLHTIINLWPRLGLEQRMTFTAVSRDYTETTAYHSGGGWVPGATGDVDGFKITTSSEGSYTFDITKWRVFGR